MVAADDEQDEPTPEPIRVIIADLQRTVPEEMRLKALLDAIEVHADGGA